MSLVGVRYWRLSTGDPAYSLTGDAISITGHGSLVDDQAEVTIERQLSKAVDVLFSLSRFDPSDGAEKGGALKPTTLLALELNFSLS